MTNTHGKRLLGYVRVSDVRGRSGASYGTEEVQEEAIRSFAERNGHTILDVLVDRDQSGGTMDRPAFNEAMRRIDSGNADGIIVYRVNRFGRTLSGGLLAAERLTKAGKVFASASEGADPTTKEGKVMFGFMMLMAELERDTIGENWMNAKTRALARGVYISAVPPFGYDRVDGKLLVNPCGVLVAQAFHHRVDDGWTIQQVADWLTEVGPERFTRQRAHALLSNPVYCGDRHYAGEVTKDSHDWLVTRDVFDRAQGMLTAGPAREARTTLLTGFARCAGCRMCLRASSAAKGARTFSCKRKHASGDCPDPVGHVVMAPVLEYVEQLFLDFAQGLLGHATPMTVDLSDAEGKLTELRADAEAFARSAAVRMPNFDELLNERLDAIELAEHELADLQSKAGLARVQRETTLVQDWPTLPLDEQRALFGEAVKAVFIRSGRGLTPAERVRIVWADEDIYLPRRNRGGSEITSYVFD
jgi:DNA invertase Pin-like site-specific DNA recombinase